MMRLNLITIAQNAINFLWPPAITAKGIFIIYVKIGLGVVGSGGLR